MTRACLPVGSGDHDQGKVGVPVEAESVFGMAFVDDRHSFRSTASWSSEIGILVIRGAMAEQDAFLGLPRALGQALHPAQGSRLMVFLVHRAASRAMRLNQSRSISPATALS